MKFITLTNESRKKIRFNVDHIVSYWARSGTTEVETIRDVEKVLETVEEIDNLLKELSA